MFCGETLVIVVGHLGPINPCPILTNIRWCPHFLSFPHRERLCSAKHKRYVKSCRGKDFGFREGRSGLRCLLAFPISIMFACAPITLSAEILKTTRAHQRDWIPVPSHLFIFQILMWNIQFSLTDNKLLLGELAALKTSFAEKFTRRAELETQNQFAIFSQWAHRD